MFCLSFGWGAALLTGWVADVFFLVKFRFFDVHGTPQPSDFGGFWAAGQQALHGPAAAVYDWAAHWDAERAAFGPAVPHHPWLYPPWFLLPVTLLALIPYAWSRLTWLALTVSGYLATVRGISPHRAAIPVAL